MIYKKIIIAYKSQQTQFNKFRDAEKRLPIVIIKKFVHFEEIKVIRWFSNT